MLIKIICWFAAGYVSRYCWNKFVLAILLRVGLLVSKRHCWILVVVGTVPLGLLFMLSIAKLYG